MKHTCISEKLQEIKQLFSEAGIRSPRLDAEVLLAHTLGVTRPYLHAHAGDALPVKTLRQIDTFIQRRLQREPVAYIVGKKDFYGREFIVTPDVLIPRPETESLVELASSRVETEGGVKQARHRELLDVGCGSGCIGITLKLERPELDVTLCDISEKALSVAKKNAENLDAEVHCIKSDLLSDLRPQIFDLIIANLPYVNKAWETLPEIDHEPQLALYAEDDGLELIKKLIAQSTDVLNEHGLLLLEADPEQHERIIAYAKTFGFTHVKTEGYALAFMKQRRA